MRGNVLGAEAGDPWARLRAWWGIADLDEAERLEWLEREATYHDEIDRREQELANEGTGA